jgi:S-ribosylhomocysteine lyase
MNTPKKIASFSVDHRYIIPGIYLSRVDGDVTTLDLRFCRPNCGSYLSNLAMHTIEHLFATYVRSSSIEDQVIYFGPMGCRTGFYLLVRDCDLNTIQDLICEILTKIMEHDGPVFGASEIECGNYRELDLPSAKEAVKQYLAELPKRTYGDFSYPTK